MVRVNTLKGSDCLGIACADQRAGVRGMRVYGDLQGFDDVGHILARIEPLHTNPDLIEPTTSAKKNRNQEHPSPVRSRRRKDYFEFP
jgi:hypothetical protein